MALKIFALAGLVALVFGGSPAPAQDLAPAGAKPQALQLKEGERAVLTMQEGGIPTIVSRGPADLSAIRAPQADTKVETAGQEAGVTNSAAPATFVATFRNFGAKGAVLRVENGYDHPLIYDAVILVRRGERVVAERTSICPILAKGVSSEGWGQPIEGVAIFGVRTPAPGDLRCSGPNALTVTPPGAPSNVCVGQTPGSPLTVRLLVDPVTGAVRRGEAVWTLADPGGPTKGPMVLLEYPMQGERIGGRPVSLQVVAFAPFQPPPTAKTASIVLLTDGQERFSRPWGLYAQRRAQLATLPAGAKPVGFVGVVPFPRTDDNAAPDAFVTLLADIGAGRPRSLEVKVVGDDASVLGARAYPLSPSPTADSATVAAAFALAKAAAAAPGHCSKPVQSSPAR